MSIAHYYGLLCIVLVAPKLSDKHRDLMVAFTAIASVVFYMTEANK